MDEELREALLRILEECAGHSNCEECPLQNVIDCGNCVPVDWLVKEVDDEV